MFSIHHHCRRSIFLPQVTTLLIEGDNDDDDELRGAAEFLVSVSPDIPWHLSAAHPDYKREDIPVTTKATLERAYRIGKAAGLHYVYIGNIHPDPSWDLNTRCPTCNTIMVDRTTNGSWSPFIMKQVCSLFLVSLAYAITNTFVVYLTRRILILTKACAENVEPK